ncbi:MAG: DMT family transporter [Anaerolineae bacterium]|nr:DMT family transporter [Anaerolineae bacterium]
MTDFTGELAALGTALAFALGSSLYTFAGRKLGSPLVNRARMFIAALMMIIIHAVAYGELLPSQASQEAVIWLSLSGIVGFALGDLFLFQAFILIGPRLSMLMMALAPVLSVILAWVLLGEILSAQSLLGIALTLAGIFWVISERQTKKTKDVSDKPPRTYFLGLLFGFGGAIGQAGGLILSKFGLNTGIEPMSGNVIRLIAATIVVWLIAAARKDLFSSLSRLRNHPKSVGYITIASLFGPVIGVSLSLLAIQLAPVGVASTLMSLTPIFLIPISYVVFKETTSWRAILGTLVAFAGTALLFV